MSDPPAPAADAPSRRAQLDRVTIYAALAAGAIGVVLLFSRLSMTGTTWDEQGDYRLARDYVENHSFIANTSDPSQGRLSHLCAAAFMAVMGPSYLALKLPFALAGLAGAAMLWSLLRRAYSVPTAALFVAFYLSNPYTLAACRQAATAGDSLVLVLAIAGVLTLHRWVTTAAFWPWGAACAIACGASTAAKWTGGLWVPAAMAVALWYGRRRHRSLFAAPLWTESLAFVSIAAGAAILGSPTFVRGLLFVREALGHSISFDQATWLYMGYFQARMPSAYFWILFASRVTPAFAVFTLVAGAALTTTAVKLRSAGPLLLIALIPLVPCLPLAGKGFQSAHYYVGAIATVVILGAAFVEHARRNKYDAPVRIAALAALAGQLFFTIDLFPDYMQASSHFGPRMQGQFWGPAVNHCQGGPLALEKMSQITEGRAALPAYVLGDCAEILASDQQFGPVHYRGGTAAFPETPPRSPYFLVINGAYGMAETSRPAWNERIALRDQATARCSPYPIRVGTYTIYPCKGDR